jgi:hypothetical protein
MVSLDECRRALGSLADNKSDDEITRMREQAAAVARIVIRTSFRLTAGASSPDGVARPTDATQGSLVEQNDGNKLERHNGRRRRRRARRRPVSQVDSSRGERRLRQRERTKQS